VLRFAFRDGMITEIEILALPERLRALSLGLLDDPS